MPPDGTTIATTRDRAACPDNTDICKMETAIDAGREVTEVAIKNFDSKAQFKAARDPFR